MHKLKVYLTSTACYIVQTETNHIASYLKSNGYDLIDKVEEAEAIIITTCAVTETSAEVTYQCIRDCMKKRKDNFPIYVVGCYTRIEKKRMKGLLENGNIISVPEIKDIENEFLGANPWESITYNNFFSHPFANEYLSQVNTSASIKSKVFKNLFRFHDSLFRKEALFYYLFADGHLYNPEVQRAIWPVIISKGCTHACSYCAVRIGRGKHTSKPMPSILNEIRSGVDKGYKRFLLIADELGPYGVDLKDGTSLSLLLRSLDTEEFPASFGLWYLDAFMFMDMVSPLESLAENGKLFFLGITIQHGSDRILELMNRHYSVPDTINAVMSLREYPDIIMATQFMVGFPTETEEDFLKTYALVETGCFDKVEVFKYSPRPGTCAARMADDVSPHVKCDRALRLRRLAARKSKKLFFKKMAAQFI